MKHVQFQVFKIFLVYIIIIAVLCGIVLISILIYYTIKNFKNVKHRRNSAYTDLITNLITDEEKDHWIISYDELTVGVCIAVGSNGRVLRGQYRGAPVAIKCLYCDKGEKQISSVMKSEFSILTRVIHPNIIKFMGVSQVRNMLLFVTEECESYINYYINRSLSMLLYQDTTPFYSDTYNRIALQICDGCLFLHNYGIIHGDLKPPNILLKHDQVKICDFGISKTLSDTILTGIVGTPQYMSPELLLDSKNTTRAIDVYAFGMVLWEMYTQCVPYNYDYYRFQDMNQFQAGLRIVKGERPVIPQSCPPKLRSFIEACWKAKPDERPTFEYVYI